MQAKTLGTDGSSQGNQQRNVPEGTRKPGRPGSEYSPCACGKEKGQRDIKKAKSDSLLAGGKEL